MGFQLLRSDTRVSFCNCHYPLVWCSKSSVCYYPPCLPKSQWEYAQNVTTRSAPVPIALEEKHSDNKVAIEQNSSEDGKVEIFLKSSLKKPREMDSEQVRKGNVKWMDLLGKELAEIKEFETDESEEPEDYTDGDTACICVIQ
ncbi:hypothetical protein C4D60_Mb05t02740 [Musa balbisiana]|uniref:Uncharacterized protein n=1 Tax=Musa balbisiana TaxID=52838 RepID=A0A4S8JT85_MUSBA|nr:hypothetical protein C4D60_Mb05t02740 [Musa balbisiana]